ncbi:MAG: hypothetical protein ABR981_01995 [Candidatus Micrarchaeaceae archaeon]|jgi:hypothetical protein
MTNRSATKEFVSVNRDGGISRSGIVDWRDYIHITLPETSIRHVYQSVTDNVRNVGHYIRLLNNGLVSEIMKNDTVNRIGNTLTEAYIDAVKEHFTEAYIDAVKEHLAIYGTPKPVQLDIERSLGYESLCYNIQIEYRFLTPKELKPTIIKKIEEKGYIFIKESNSGLLSFEVEIPYIPPEIIATLKVGLNIEKGNW